MARKPLTGDIPVRIDITLTGKLARAIRTEAATYGLTFPEAVRSILYTGISMSNHSFPGVTNLFTIKDTLMSAERVGTKLLRYEKRNKGENDEPVKP